MLNKKLSLVILGIVVVIVVAIVSIGNSNRERSRGTAENNRLITKQENLSTVQFQTPKENESPIFVLSQEERDAFFDTMVQDKQWPVIVNATNDGIENYQELVWDDLRFWTARALALWQLGRCIDAGAAAYHVVTRDPEHQLAASILVSVQDETLCKELGT